MDSEYQPVTPGEWRVHGSRSVYESDWIDVELVDVESPDGRRFEHHVARMQQVAVALVSEPDSGRVLMLRRHRFINASWGWELPVGIVEPGEDPVAAAVRETIEETGWRPLAMREVLRYQPVIGIGDTPHVIVAGVGATHVSAPVDVNEAAELRWVPREELAEMVELAEVRDGASLTAVLMVLAGLAPSV